MRDSEYIAWKSETRMQIEKEHPDWTKEQVQEFLDKVESSLRKRGFFDIVEERNVQNMSERKYFEINETAAKTANDMMSFRDYVPGTKTANYRAMVDECYGIADMVAERRPDSADRAYRLAERYAKKMADNMNDEIRIGCMCPSVMISGAGNFPVRKKEKQNAAWERNMEEYKHIQEIKTKIENILYGREQIKSGDADAIEKLESKLKKLKDNQEEMKAANRAVRLKDTEKGNAKLRDMGYSDTQIKQLREPDFCGRVGYPDYALRNNNANTRRVESRLKSLKAAKENGTSELETDVCKVVENTEQMRLQLIFDGKPDPEVRDILKKNGFRWSPKNTAWQRQLTNNARYSAKRVIEEIKEVIA